MSAHSQRSWFITGCDKGIGYAIAEAALKQGDRVAVTVLNKEGRTSLADAYGARCHGYHLDVTDANAIRTVVARAEESFDGLDVVVNNAGYGARRCRGGNPTRRVSANV